MEATRSIEARNKNLKDVLFAARRFRVPRYQRPYAWETEEVTEFWEDLVSTEEPYFLGSFIFNTEQETDEGYVDIIDGQQRLLTVTILCAAMRDCARRLDPLKASLYQRQDIAIEGRDGAQSYRIQPAESISDFFENNIQQDRPMPLQVKTRTPEEQRVLDNYTFLQDKLSVDLDAKPTREAKLERLDYIRQKLANLVLISVEIAREEDAYEIFETTNARGLELSVADLLKNLIFRKIPSGDKGDPAKEEWSEITENIESTNTDLRKFIRHFWISRYAFLPEKQLYREIKSKISDWDRLLRELGEDSKWYGRMLVGMEQDFEELKHGRRIFDSLFALRLMGVSQCYVLLLAILRNHERLGTDPARIFQMIEKFSFKYTAICKQPPNRIEKLYSRFAIKIEEAASQPDGKQRSAAIQSIFSQLEKEIKELSPLEDIFHKQFASLSYRNSEESRKLIKYILGRVNAYLGKTDEQQIDFDKVNIEHILPSKPHKEWKVKRAEIKSYVNLIGNLTLLSERLNSIAQNGTIDQKLPVLEESQLPITQELVKRLKGLQGKWDEEEIRERQQELGILAFEQIWS